MRLRPRRLYILVVICIFISSLYLLIRSVINIEPLNPTLQVRTTNNFSRFLIDTPGCTIPHVDAFDEQISSLVWRTGSLQCQGRPDLTYQDGEFLRINWDAVENIYRGDFSHCEYQPIIRLPDRSDNRVTYTNTRQKFNQDIRVDCEFMRVYCYSNSDGVIYVNFHAFVLPRADFHWRLKRLKKRIKENEMLETFSVLMVGLDSVSRLNSIRQLPRLRKYLLKTLKGFELKGYNKVAENTFVNVVPMSTGKHVKELPWSERMSKETFDKYTFIWNRFQDFGYRTLYAEDAPHIAIFNYLKAGFGKAPADYYMRPFNLAMEKHRNLWSNNDNCFGTRLETNIVMDWVRDFVSTSQKHPFFAFTFLTRLTHSNVNDVGAADEPHTEFVEFLHKSDTLKNTILIYFSDHGMRFGNIRTTYIGKLEDRLPLMIIVFPLWFRQKYPYLARNVRLNSLRLTTPFDIYETLLDILHFNKSVVSNSRSFSSRGISLFNVVPKGRTCSHSGILSHWCSCHKHQSISTNSAVALLGAKVAADFINQRTEKVRSLCPELTVLSIKEAWKTTANDDVLRFHSSLNDVINRTVLYGARTDAIVDYQMFVVMKPSLAIFEVTVRYNEQTDSMTIVDDIARISEIGDQADCVSDPGLKKFCYCNYL